MAYTYWRIYVDFNNGDTDYTTVAGLDFLDSGMSSLVSGGTAICSSEWLPTLSAAAAFTGYPNYWSTAPSMGAEAAWIGYQFPGAVDVYYFTMTGVSQADRMPRYMRVEASNDGVTWDRIAVMLEQTGWTVTGSDNRTFDITDPGEAILPFIMDQPLIDGYSNIETALAIGQPLHDGYSVIECAYFFAQSLLPVFPEGNVSTEKLPGFGNSVANNAIPAAADPFSTALPGLSFSVKKKPVFKTNIKEAASGQETRNSLTQMPRWDFELRYEYLNDPASGESALKTLMGFFLEMGGRFDSWLFKDPDDYQSTGSLIGTGDGVTTDFPLTRTFGNFAEIIGQVDTTNTIAITQQATESGTIPGTPYQVTVAHAADFAANVSVMIDGVAGVLVTGTPSAGQYAVNTGTGVYTFAAANTADPYIITYTYDVGSGYTVVLPNIISFAVAPTTGEEIYATFQYFFQCRFTDDEQDYEKFMDRLWNLQSMEFRSILS
jgi:hypothetical protein